MNRQSCPRINEQLGVFSTLSAQQRRIRVKQSEAMRTAFNQLATDSECGPINHFGKLTRIHFENSVGTGHFILQGHEHGVIEQAVRGTDCEESWWQLLGCQ